jgi:hypothetical protein
MRKCRQVVAPSFTTVLSSCDGQRVPELLPGLEIDSQSVSGGGVEPAVGIPPRSVAGSARSNRRGRLVALAIGLVAALWFLILSHWLLVAPGTIMIERRDVFLEADTALILSYIAGEEGTVVPPQFLVVHPLYLYTWRPVALALSVPLELFWSAEHALILAGRIMMALIAGGGVGLLALLSARRGVRLAHNALLFAMYLLFTANTLAVLPGHLGLSSGLLSLAFFLLLEVKSTYRRTVALAFLTLLIGGTTVTNSVFATACLLFPLRRNPRLVGLLSPRRAAVAAAIALLGVLPACILLASKASNYVNSYLNLRMVTDPLKAGLYGLLGLVYPAIAPNPHTIVEGDLKLNMLSYEPLGLYQYSGIQGIGAIAWVVLLTTCTAKALRDNDVRPHAWLLLSWIGFNAVLHNVWGDEFMFYSPHWSWALMALVILGARDRPLRFLAVLVTPIMIGQVCTLTQIGSVLRSITS